MCSSQIYVGQYNCTGYYINPVILTYKRLRGHHLGLGHFKNILSAPFGLSKRSFTQ